MFSSLKITILSLTLNDSVVKTAGHFQKLSPLAIELIVFKPRQNEVLLFVFFYILIKVSPAEYFSYFVVL